MQAVACASVALPVPAHRWQAGHWQVSKSRGSSAPATAGCTGGARQSAAPAEGRRPFVLRQPASQTGVPVGRAWRSVEQYTLHVMDAQALDDRRREDARRKGPPEDLLELQVQAADAQPLEVELLVLEELRGDHAACARVVVVVVCARASAFVCVEWGRNDDS